MTNQEKIDAISVLNQTIAVCSGNGETSTSKAALAKVEELIKSLGIND